MAGSASALNQFHCRLSPPSALWTVDRPLRIKTKAFESLPLASPTNKSPTLLKSPISFSGNTSCSSPGSSFCGNTCASPRTCHGGNGSPHFQSSTASGSTAEASFLYVKPHTQVDKPVTFYDVLGISDMVTDDEIKAAFRSMAKRYHPDHAPPEMASEFEKKFMEVHKAYSILKDPRTRALYNYEIKSTVLSNQRSHDARKGQWQGRNWETDQCWWVYFIEYIVAADTELSEFKLVLDADAIVFSCVQGPVRLSVTKAEFRSSVAGCEFRR